LNALSGKVRRNVKVCPKCSGELALLWKDRKRSENAYASEKIHNLICTMCGFGRTERFIDKKYPIQARYVDGKIIFTDSEGDDAFTPMMDAATIARSE